MASKLLSCVFGPVTIPQRYIMIGMIQLAMVNAYHLRVVLNIAITEIIGPRNHTGAVDACPNYVYEALEIKGGTYEWPVWIESFILYSFYIGNSISHIPGGWLADKFGAKHVMGTCILVSSILNLLYPLAISKGGYTAAIVLRTFVGLFQGPLHPTITTFIQCWVPIKERALLVSIAFGGSTLGAVTGNVFSGMIIKRTRSWPMAFYICGIFGMVWYSFYIFMVYSKPSTHPFITEEELQMLDEQVENRKSFKVPWVKILRSSPVWALVAGQFVHSYIFFTVMTDLPKYLKEILKVNVENNGIATALPFLALWISQILFAYFADYIVNKNIISVLRARKLFTAFSAVVPASVLVLVVYIGCNRTLVITLYTMALFLVGPFFSGMKVNLNDVTIHYGGTIAAIVSCIASTTGVWGPLIVGFLTPNSSLGEWQKVFLIMLGVAILLSIFYCVFASAERQKWDYLDDEIDEN
ncbi:unnamed protein product [Phaedon cochleariae]|uniref:Major facilitator superfamily (MFS) profile domain-containing protein n=1 Tax=Phaedon cochleariae TaxID=80249 RepID=A0A9N9X388_PHACE|nr:unnamed protein product [Phaedon cochleariae]